MATTAPALFDVALVAASATSAALFDVVTVVKPTPRAPARHRRPSPALFVPTLTATDTRDALFGVVCH